MQYMYTTLYRLGRQGKVTVWDVKTEAAKNHFETPDPSFCNFTLLTPSQDGEYPKSLLFCNESLYHYRHIHYSTC